MASEKTTSRTQCGFFSESGELGGDHARFTEICTALYERALFALSHADTANTSLLQRRLGGLPYHVRSVARFMVSQNQTTSPLQVDTHNGSWMSKQPAKCPGLKKDEQACTNWYRKHTEYGLVVPVLIESLEGFTIELDSIDMFSHERGQVHLNKSGWFYCDGNPTAPHSQADTPTLLTTMKHTLLKPTKAILMSACCGHVWSHKSKSSPRSLSIREMRLSTEINWKTFTLPIKK